MGSRLLLSCAGALILCRTLAFPVTRHRPNPLGGPKFIFPAAFFNGAANTRAYAGRRTASDRDDNLIEEGQVHIQLPEHW
jgi:hypothetical protein